MQKYSLKIKILLSAGLISAMPFITSAHEGHDHEATTTEPFQANSEAAIIKAVLETPKKDEKKDNIRKQLNDTIELCSALINKIQNLAKRVSERESIVMAQGNLSEESKEEIDLLQKKLDATLAGANDKINNNLPKIADTIASSTKPAKLVKDFRKEVSKVKAEIISAHKLVIEIIDLIKKETLKSEIGAEESEEDEATTSPEQN